MEIDAINPGSDPDENKKRLNADTMSWASASTTNSVESVHVEVTPTIC